MISSDALALSQEVSREPSLSPWKRISMLLKFGSDNFWVLLRDTQEGAPTLGCRALAAGSVHKNNFAKPLQGGHSSPCKTRGQDPGASASRRPASLSPGGLLPPRPRGRRDTASPKATESPWGGGTPALVHIKGFRSTWARCWSYAGSSLAFQTREGPAERRSRPEAPGSAPIRVGLAPGPLFAGR